MSRRLKIISPMATGSGAYVIHRLLENHIPRYRVASYHPNWTFIPFALPVVAKIKNADLIHTVPDYAPFFYRKSVPLIISFQNYVLDSWMRPYSSFLQKLHSAVDLKFWTKLAINRAIKITAVSEFTANLVKEDMKLSLPIDVIYNGVDTNHFTPNAGRKKNHKEVHVFFSGNLTRRKGAHWLPEIAKLLDQNIKIFYTKGLRTRKTLPNLPNLESRGPVQFEDMPDHYRRMDILLMPTIREGLSLSVLEAMACGLPVVTSNCSSLPEQIDEGQGGFLCPAGDVKAFAEKINFLADSPKIRNEMGNYNRAKVEKKFTLEKMVEKYKNVFEEILSASK
jgi:glycosyltransferase involved in cell wall biosynthesis